MLSKRIYNNSWWDEGVLRPFLAGAAIPLPAMYTYALSKRKKSFNMLGLPFFSKLGWGSYIVSIAKSSSNKITTLTHFIKFFS